MAKKKKINVQGSAISLLQITEQEDYISLTDIMKRFDDEFAIYSWMRNKNTVEFLGVWEQLHNPNFKGNEFVTFRNEAGSNSFNLTPKKWIKATEAIGMIAKSGRYGGTYAHSDIAINFCYWLSPTFQLYLIKEFQRLKEVESSKQKLEWSANRFLSKRNYSLQTEAIKQTLLPTSTHKKEDQWIEYASEADILNGALFGTTAKQWRESHLAEAKQGENIRDHATNIQLIVLSNLEAINAELIREGVSKEERYLRLQQAALFQLGIYYRDQQLINKKLGK